MVTDAFSQLGLPTPQFAVASVEPWVVLLVLAIIWLALGGGRSPRQPGSASHA